MKGNYGKFFLLCRKIVRIATKKYEVDLSSVDKSAPVVYVSHHQNLFGPFMAYLWMPEMIRVWMLHVFLDREACYRQYKEYTFTKRFDWNKKAAGLAANLVSFFVTSLMKSGRGVPVYRGTRDVLKTFQMSVEALENNEKLAVFPDIDYQDSGSKVKEMYTGFLYIEKYYYRKTGKHVHFVPLYISKSKRKMIAGDPIVFSGEKSFRKQSESVLKQIKDRLNQFAKEFGDLE
jgi:hypothetical protein